jgi:BMFP domain-containing protein YqiC
LCFLNYYRQNFINFIETAFDFMTSCLDLNELNKKGLTLVQLDEMIKNTGLTLVGNSTERYSKENLDRILEKIIDQVKREEFDIPRENRIYSREQIDYIVKNIGDTSNFNTASETTKTLINKQLARLKDIGKYNGRHMIGEYSSMKLASKFLNVELKLFNDYFENEYIGEGLGNLIPMIRKGHV